MRQIKSVVPAILIFSVCGCRHNGPTTVTDPIVDITDAGFADADDTCKGMAEGDFCGGSEHDTVYGKCSSDGACEWKNWLCGDKVDGDICDGAPGDPIYRVCDKAGGCVFPPWTCTSSAPGDDCASGACTTPISECNIGEMCITDSYCCTGCLDVNGHCRKGSDGILCGNGGESCYKCD